MKSARPKSTGSKSGEWRIWSIWNRRIVLCALQAENFACTRSAQKKRAEWLPLTSITAARDAQAALCGMSADFAAQIFEHIHEESVRQQLEIVNK